MKSPLEQMPDRCDQCRFFRRDEDAPQDEGGSCRRYPPKVMGLGNEFVTVFPSVPPAISRGEFSPRLH